MKDQISYQIIGGIKYICVTLLEGMTNQFDENETHNQIISIVNTIAMNSIHNKRFVRKISTKLKP